MMIGRHLTSLSRHTLVCSYGRDKEWVRSCFVLLVAIAIGESGKALGPEHTSTLSTTNNLGILYKDQGKLAEAEEMYQRALSEYEKVWGLDHIPTLSAVNYLANLFSS